MSQRDTLESMERRIAAKVKGGQIVLENVAIAEGTTVTVLVDEEQLRMPGPSVEIDENGDLVMTPELEAELAEAEAEGDRGEGIPWEQVRAELFLKR
jgi:hypothetical protein